MIQIFSDLDNTARNACAVTCKEWERLANDRSLYVFGVKAWERVFHVKAGPEIPIPLELLSLIQQKNPYVSPCSRHYTESYAYGPHDVPTALFRDCVIFLLPAQVNDQDYNVTQLISLAKGTEKCFQMSVININPKITG